MARFLRLAFWIIILTGSLTAVKSADVPVLEIPARVIVPGPRIYLADLGTVRDASETERMHLMVDLGPAPYPGQVRILTRDYLELILKQRGYNQPVNIRMEKQVEIRVESACITSSQLETAINKLLPEPNAYLKKQWIELRNLPDEIWVSKGEWKIEAVPLKDLPRIGNVLFRVTLSKESEIKTINVSGKIRAIGKVYRSSRDINRFSLINDSDFELIETELSSGEEVLGEFPRQSRTTRVIKKGQILRTSQFQPIPLVIRENFVNVTVVDGNIAIKMTGIAKTDGWFGDQVTVLNPTSEKVFQGRVIGPNLVEVNF